MITKEQYIKIAESQPDETWTKSEYFRNNCYCQHGFVLHALGATDEDLCLARGTMELAFKTMPFFSWILLGGIATANDRASSRSEATRNIAEVLGVLLTED